MVRDQKLHRHVLTVASFINIIADFLRHDVRVHAEVVVVQKGGLCQNNAVASMPPHTPPATVDPTLHATNVYPRHEPNERPAASSPNLVREMQLLTRDPHVVIH